MKDAEDYYNSGVALKPEITPDEAKYWSIVNNDLPESNDE